MFCKAALKCRLYWELVTFLLTPNSNCITSVKDVGLQSTPLRRSLRGIISEFISWSSDIVGIQAIWPPCLATRTATLYNPQHATTHQLAVYGAQYTHTHIAQGLVTRHWGRCVSVAPPNIILGVRFRSRTISGVQHRFKYILSKWTSWIAP